ncbi:hypothetical protein VLK31_34675 [Variovorax sp. H27-G14]|uniref:hypothetical protein n=1 Tax=Variovorax sp. H27-G14 TaxID=3111914 RepID=UPI0038FC52F6
MSEQERFEKFWLYSRAGKGAGKAQSQLTKHANGDYTDESTQRHWWTWQQAAIRNTKESATHLSGGGRKEE